MIDRPSAPNVVANRTDEHTIEAIAALRRLRFTGPEIAEVLDRPVSTVSGILTRIGMGKLGRLGLEPVERYERQVAGELIHIDVKKLGRIHGGAGKRITGVKRNPRRTRRDSEGRDRRIVGWEYVHIAIDDATRLAYAEVLPDEKAVTAIGFLRRAIAFFESYGMTVDELITDNGSAYRSTMHAIACRALGIRHLRTRPRRPQTNGKAERFIRTMLGGWAYGAIYATSAERTAALDGWLYRYNHHRPTLSHRPTTTDQPPEQPARVLQLGHGAGDGPGWVRPKRRNVVSVLPRASITHTLSLPMSARGRAPRAPNVAAGDHRPVRSRTYESCLSQGIRPPSTAASRNSLWCNPAVRNKRPSVFSSDSKR